MVDALLTLVSVAVAALAGYRMWQRAMQERGGSVKALPAPAPVVTSSGREQQHASSASVSQTDSPQTADRPLAPAITREQMLDAAKTLRAAGLSREKGRAVFSALGLPLDNNLWAAAAPPEPEADYVTPIAGRATKKAYYPDEPELEFAPPTS